MKFYVYKDKAGEWRWRLEAGNNQVIAVSGEGYRDKRECHSGIGLVKLSASAPVVELPA